MKRIVSATFALMLTVTGACTKKNKDEDPGFKFEKGFGRSEERPEGLAYRWPDGIRLLDKPGTEDECFEAMHKQKHLYGHGGDVALCLNFYNETDQPIRVNLPPGLMFVSKTIEAQNGMLLTGVTIEVPAKEQYFAELFMICVNPPRHTSTGYEYEEQPIITDHPALRELIASLRNKKCNYEDYGSVYPNQLALEIGATIATAASDLIYGKPIHQQEREAMAKIPLK